MWSTGWHGLSRRLALLLFGCLVPVRTCYARLVLAFLGLGCLSVLDDSSAREVDRGWDELTGLADYFPRCLLCLQARVVPVLVLSQVYFSAIEADNIHVEYS